MVVLTVPDFRDSFNFWLYNVISPATLFEADYLLPFQIHPKFPVDSIFLAAVTHYSHTAPLAKVIEEVNPLNTQPAFFLGHRTAPCEVLSVHPGCRISPLSYVSLSAFEPPCSPITLGSLWLEPAAAGLMFSSSSSRSWKRRWGAGEQQRGGGLVHSCYSRLGLSG